MLLHVLPIFVSLLAQSHCRKHNLHIENDRRQFIPLSTFGFYTGGKLQVNMTGFKMDIFDVVDVAGVKDEMVVGFSIDKTVSDALNPYVQATETQCILTKQPAEKEKAGILRFTLDFDKKRTVIHCSKNIRSITILASDSKDADESLSALSDSQMFRPKRSSSMNDPDAAFTLEKGLGSDLDAEIQNYYMANNNSAAGVDDDSKKFHKFFMASPDDTAANGESAGEKLIKPSAEKLVQKSSFKPEKAYEMGSTVIEASAQKNDIDDPKKNKAHGQEDPEGDTQNGDECGEEVSVYLNVYLQCRIYIEDSTWKQCSMKRFQWSVLQVVPLTMSEDGRFQTSFVIYIRDAKHEGLYSMFFHNCYNYIHRY